MCIFTAAVQSVAHTRIFARPTGAGRQVLVYSMSIAAGRELAMILPLPVPEGTLEGGVRFIDLEDYATFFEDMAQGYPVLECLGPPSSGAPEAPRLLVHDVGSFEASFVPTLADFDRLDERFRLPKDLWAEIPQYADYGFAVFKLRDVGGSLNPGNEHAIDGTRVRTLHPMAFEFPRRDPSALFLPTVHIHDGVVHPDADFDHTLYAQGDDVVDPRRASWWPSAGPARTFLAAERAKGTVNPDAHCFRIDLSGRLPNRDTWIKA